MDNSIDCLEMKDKIQEQLWLSSGESLEELKKCLLDKDHNILYQSLLKKKKEHNELKAA